jgi:DDE superfamily endonuclease/Helix-turn-helix of DDE superfamily endonuclease
MTPKEFTQLLPIFTEVLIATALSKPGRQRKHGGWRKGNIVDGSSMDGSSMDGSSLTGGDDTSGSTIKDPAQKLFFILVFMKVYPTYDLAAYMFRSSRTRTHCRVTELLPVLSKVLGRTLSLPARQISSPEEFFSLFPGVKEVMIDGVERPSVRRKKPKIQTKNYSGKKKWPRRKNTIMSDKTKKILYISPTKNGKLHDKKQIDKTTIIPHIPDEVTVLADSGYQWIQKVHPNTYIPKKNSKKNPLTREEKDENHLISSARVVIENAICWMKRFATASGTFRWRSGQDDTYMLLAAGLWNFHLQMRECGIS